MAKLTEYPEAQSFDENDILIKDGTNGTKKIKIEKVLEYMVDPTLTTPGKAADAKATKDAIDVVGGEVADVKTQLKSRFNGKKISIIGDSIDTFNKEGYKIAGYNMYYPALDVTDVNQTWWKKVIDNSGAKIEVNASWSGSRVTDTDNHTPKYPDFYDRVSVIGSPDVIFVTLGTNDSSNTITLGDYDFTTEYTSLSESTFRTAYIKGVKALKALYPSAEIVCISEKMTEGYRASIEYIAKKLSVEYIDASDYIASSSAHPGTLGMSQIASLILYPTDNGLWQKHYPADAAKTGDEIASLKIQIDNNPNDLRNNERYVSTYLQGVRYPGNPSVVVRANNRCTSIPVEVWQGDTLTVSNIPTGFRASFISTDGRTKSWTTVDFTIIANSHAFFYVNVSTEDGTSQLTPEDFTLSLKIIDKSSRVYTLESDISDIVNDVTTQTNRIDYTDSVLFTKKNDVPWEIGNITVTNERWTWWTTPNDKRIRTPEGKQMNITKGSIIKLSDYTDAEFAVGMRKDGVYYTLPSWVGEGEVIAPITGEYIFIIRNKVEKEQTDVNALASLFELYIFGLSELNKRTADNETNINLLQEDVTKNVEDIEALQNFPFGLNSPILVPSKPRMIMHRGYSSIAPENTAAAFELAGKGGAWGIETDIHETTDGYFVCFHDNDVDRMTDGTGNINEMTLAEVKALTIDTGSGIAQYPNEKIPTLEEYLAICKRYGCIAFIEWKYIIHEGNMVDIVKKYGMENSSIYVVGAVKTCNRLRVYTNAPCMMIGFSSSVDIDIIDAAATGKNLWCGLIYRNDNNSTLPFYAHSKNVPLSVYTINNSTLADSLFRYGYDMMLTETIPVMPNN